VQIFELLTGGDYLFDPAAAARYNKDDDHLAQMVELLGEMPMSVLKEAKHAGDYFDEKGVSIHMLLANYKCLRLRRTAT
jgi:serine/threonine-protein kinase SRPK3